MAFDSGHAFMDISLLSSDLQEEYIKYAHKFTYVTPQWQAFLGGSVVMNLSAM